MREILFRAKCIDNGEWVEGHYGEYYNGNKNVPCISIPSKEAVSGSLCYEVIPETIFEFTGLTDKNGLTKIFENGYMIIDNKTYKVIFDNAEYILTNIFNCDIITLKNNSIKGAFVDEI